MADNEDSGVDRRGVLECMVATGVLWTVFFSVPFMVAIQLVSARIGRQSGQGIAANLRAHSPR